MVGRSQWVIYLSNRTKPHRQSFAHRRGQVGTGNVKACTLHPTHAVRSKLLGKVKA